MEGGPDRKFKLDHSPAVDELYIEGYLQAMLDTMCRQEYLRVRVIENQVSVKDFVPAGLAYLMKQSTEPEIVKNFLLKTLHLQEMQRGNQMSSRKRFFQDLQKEGTSASKTSDGEHADAKEQLEGGMNDLRENADNNIFSFL